MEIQVRGIDVTVINHRRRTSVTIKHPASEVCYSVCFMTFENFRAPTTTTI